MEAQTPDQNSKENLLNPGGSHDARRGDVKEENKKTHSCTEQYKEMTYSRLMYLDMVKRLVLLCLVATCSTVA